MSGLAVLGAGAFGTALAISLAKEGRPVTLWKRDDRSAKEMQNQRTSGSRLPGFRLPEKVTVTSDLTEISAPTGLLAVPMAALPALLGRSDFPTFCVAIGCMKGIDPKTGHTPSRLIASALPDTEPAALTGPSFAVDIAAGLPTALTLATPVEATGKKLQRQLSTSSLRIYRTTDLIGAELGGALKNVVAIAAGITIGANLGDSARAAIISRGLAEMSRIARHFGADPTTLSGLSGLGDLVLTATSTKSRNFRAGLALGAGEPLPNETTEGIATAKAVSNLAARNNIEAPIARTIDRLIQNQTSLETAMTDLLSRPATKE